MFDTEEKCIKLIINRKFVKFLRTGKGRKMIIFKIQTINIGKESLRSVYRLLQNIWYQFLKDSRGVKEEIYDGLGRISIKLFGENKLIMYAFL